MTRWVWLLYIGALISLRSSGLQNNVEKSEDDLDSLDESIDDIDDEGSSIDPNATDMMLANWSSGRREGPRPGGKQRLWKAIRREVRDMKNILPTLASNISWMESDVKDMNRNYFSLVGDVRVVKSEVMIIKRLAHTIWQNVTDTRRDHKRMNKTLWLILNNVTLVVEDVEKAAKVVTDMSLAYGRISKRVAEAVDRIPSLSAVSDTLESMNSEFGQLKSSLDFGTEQVNKEMQMLSQIVYKMGHVLFGIRDNVSRLFPKLDREIMAEVSDISVELAKQAELITNMATNVGDLTNNIYDGSRRNDDILQLLKELGEHVDVVGDRMITVSNNVTRAQSMVVLVDEKVTLIGSNLVEVYQQIGDIGFNVTMITTQFESLPSRIYQGFEKVETNMGDVHQEIISGVGSIKGDLMDMKVQLSDIIKVIEKKCESTHHCPDVECEDQTCPSGTQPITGDVTHGEDKTHIIRTTTTTVKPTQIPVFSTYPPSSPETVPTTPIRPVVLPEQPTTQPQPIYPTQGYSSTSPHPSEQPQEQPSTPSQPSHQTQTYPSTSFQPIYPGYPPTVDQTPGYPPSSPYPMPVYPQYPPTTMYPPVTTGYPYPYPSSTVYPPMWTTTMFPPTYPTTIYRPSSTTTAFYPVTTIFPPTVEYPSSPSIPAGASDNGVPPRDSTPRDVTSTPETGLGLPPGPDGPGLPIGCGDKFISMCACSCPCDCTCPVVAQGLLPVQSSLYDRNPLIPRKQCQCICSCPCSPGDESVTMGSRPIEPVVTPSPNNELTELITREIRGLHNEIEEIKLSVEYENKQTREVILDEMDKKFDDFSREVRIILDGNLSLTTNAQNFTFSLESVKNQLFGEINRIVWVVQSLGSDIMKTMLAMFYGGSSGNGNGNGGMDWWDMRPMTRPDRPPIGRPYDPRLDRPPYRPRPPPHYPRPPMHAPGTHLGIPHARPPSNRPIQANIWDKLESPGWPETSEVTLPNDYSITPSKGSYYSRNEAERRLENETPSIITTTEISKTSSPELRILSVNATDVANATSTVTVKNTDNKIRMKKKKKKKKKKRKKKKKKKKRKKKAYNDMDCTTLAEQEKGSVLKANSPEKSTLADDPSDYPDFHNFARVSGDVEIDDNLGRMVSPLDPFAFHNILQNKINNQLMRPVRPRVVKRYKGKRQRPRLYRNRYRKRPHSWFPIAHGFPFIRPPIPPIPPMSHPFRIPQPFIPPMPRIPRLPNLPDIFSAIPHRINGSPYSVSYNDGKGSSINFNMNRRSNNVGAPGLEEHDQANENHKTEENSAEKIQEIGEEKFIDKQEIGDENQTEESQKSDKNIEEGQKVAEEENEDEEDEEVEDEEMEEEEEEEEQENEEADINEVAEQQENKEDDINEVAEQQENGEDDINEVAEQQVEQQEKEPDNIEEAVKLQEMEIDESNESSEQQ